MSSLFGRVIHKYLIILAGVPAIKQFGGKEPLTTEPAATTVLFEIVLPSKNVTLVQSTIVANLYSFSVVPWSFISLFFYQNYDFVNES